MIRILCTDISSADEKVYKSLYENASDERKRRAERYRKYEDKLRCVTSDALLRSALKADDFQIYKNKYGKPYVKDRENFHYNLSHSGRYVVIAFGESEVGVDIQKHDSKTDIRMIAEQYFTSDEMEYIFQSNRGRSERFYEIWTGKESYLKYIGKGLYKSMKSFSILDWKQEIRLLYPTEGYTMSLCTEDREYTFELLDLRQLI